MSRGGQGSFIDPEAMQDAQEWIEAVTGVAFAGDFGESLKDGQMLCMLVNAIRRGSVRKINESKLPFKQMENISNFLRACRTLGVAEHDVFETVDLFELKDLSVVVKCIWALGRAVQTTVPEFEGPHLGVPETTRTTLSRPSNFDAARPSFTSMATLGRFSMGSAATMQKQENRYWDATSGNRTVGAGDTSVVSKLQSGSSGIMERKKIVVSGPTLGADAAAGRAEATNSPAASPRLAPPKPPRLGGEYINSDTAKTAALAPPSVGGLEQFAETSYRQRAHTEPPAPVSARGGGYGLDAQLAQIRLDKYDYDLEAEVKEWIEAVTGEAFPGGFGESLKDGRILCKLINAIKPGSIRIINTSKLPFKQMENVSVFLRNCRALGVAEHDLFETVDLYELKDLGVVVNCIHALGGAVQKTVPSFAGPFIGVKRSDKNVRSYTEEQLVQQRANAALPARLNTGSAGIMERSEVRAGNDPTFGNRAVGSGSEGISAQTIGSAGVMERAEVRYNDPTFGNRAAGSGAEVAAMINEGDLHTMQRPEVRYTDPTWGARAANGSLSAAGQQ